MVQYHSILHVLVAKRVCNTWLMFPFVIKLTIDSTFLSLSKLLNSLLFITSCRNAMTKNPSVKELVRRSNEEIIGFLQGIYEHSAWVAEGLVQGCPALASFETVSQLASAMKAIVDCAPRERKLELLCAHPDLCEKVGKIGELTKESQEEQSRAGLQSLTDDELEKFTTANTDYRSKFGFPFILAVRNATKFTVLSALLGRLSNSEEKEFLNALTQVHKIAWMRLLSAIDTEDAKGFLTCHVLDTANGCPANKMRIMLHRVSPENSAGFVAEYITNEDGRLDKGPALEGGKDFIVGTYVFTFFVADYFAAKGNYFTGTPFLDEIPIRFGIDNPDDHYHVPLLVSPWSFSTYRGS